MSPAFLFRASIILGPLLAIAAAVYGHLAAPAQPEDVQHVLAYSGHGGLLPNSDGEPSPTDIALLAVGAFFILIAVGTQIALFFYWRPARFLFTVITLAAFAFQPWLGMTVSLGLESTGNDLATFCSGITLALAYWSPVADRFDPPA